MVKCLPIQSGGFLIWLPAYFADTFALDFALDLNKPSLHLAVVYAATTLGSIGGGHLSSYFIRKGWPVLKARKTTLLIVAIAVVRIFLPSLQPISGQQ